jgi:hypothetical protein
MLVEKKNKIDECKIKRKRVNYIDTSKFIVKLHLAYPIFKKNTPAPKRSK